MSLEGWVAYAGRAAVHVVFAGIGSWDWCLLWGDGARRSLASLDFRRVAVLRWSIPRDIVRTHSSRLRKGKRYSARHASTARIVNCGLVLRRMVSVLTEERGEDSRHSVASFALDPRHKRHSGVYGTYLTALQVRDPSA